MSTQELYRFTGATAPDAVIHGRYYVVGTATGTISFRRGLDISAAFDTKAAIDGAFGGSTAGVALSAQAEVKAGLQLQAKLPLDVFNPPGAGLVVRLLVGGSASASLAVTGTLALGELIDRLLPDFGGAWDTLLPLILDELDISVGVWAHVAVAAEVQAQAIVAASILPSSDPAQQPGFTFQFGYRAGFTFGAGVSVVVNVGLLQPDRLIARLAERLAGVAADALDASAAIISDAPARDATYAAGALARVLIPLGLESAYQVGAAAIDTTDRSAKASTATSDQLIHQAQMLVLRAVVQFGAKELSRILNTSVIVDAMLLLDDPGAVLAPLHDVAAAIEGLHRTDTVTGAQFVTAVEALIGAVQAVLDTPVFAGPRVDRVRRGLAIVWSAAQLVQAVTTHATAPSATDAGQFHSTSAPLPGRGAALAQQIPHQGAQPTLGEIVTFLTSGVLAEVENDVAWAAHVGAWLETALGLPGGGIAAVFGALFGSLLSPAPAAAAHLVAALAPAIAEATGRLRSQALGPLIAASAGDPPLASLLSDVVDPLLDAVPVVVLPSLTQLHDDAAAERAREALASIVLQSLGKFVQDVTVQLVEDAMGRDAASLNATADDIAARGADAPAYHELSQIGLGGLLTVSEAERLLRITAQALWDADTAMHDAFTLTAADSTAALTDAATRADHLRQLLSDDQPPRGVDLDAACRQLTASALLLGTEVIPPYLNFAAGWLGRRIQDLADEGSRLAGQFIAWVDDELVNLHAAADALTDQILEWERKIGLEMAGVAAEIARIVAAFDKLFRTQVIGSLRARGHQLINEVVPDLPGWRDEAGKILDDLLNIASSVESIVAQLLSTAASAAADALNTAAQSGQVSTSSVHNHVRSTVFASSRHDLAAGITVFGISFPVTVTSADVAGAAWSHIASSATYDGAVNDGVQHAQTATSYRGQRNNCQAVRDQNITAQQALSAAGNLVPARPLSVTIETPSTDSSATGHVRLQIRLRGANRTFVEPTLGLAQRVILRINDVAVAHDGSWWWVDGSDLVLAARLAPVVPQDAASFHARISPAAAERRLVESVTIVKADAEDEETGSATGSRRSATRYVRVDPPAAAERSPFATTTGPGSSLRPPDHTLAKDGANLDVYEDPPRPQPTVHQTTPVSRQAPPAGGTVVIEWPDTVLWVPPAAALPTLAGIRGVNTIQVAVYDGAGRMSSDVATVVLSGPDDDLRQQVAQAAYFCWVQRGRPTGSSTQDWLAAEADILHSLIATLAFHYALDRGYTPGRNLEDWLRAEQAMHLHMAL